VNRATGAPGIPHAVAGTELPALEVPVTRTLIVAGAIASRDFEPVHHDHVVAQERGSADLFMNILTTNGLIGRFVTDWTGPDARLRRIDIRLGVPAYPGDTLRLTGTVVEVVAAGDGTDSAAGDGDDGDGRDDGAGGSRGRRVVVAVRAANARGDHARGTVEVEVVEVEQEVARP
jgi:acyl dehydratase